MEKGYEQIDLCTCLVEGLAGEFHSAAARELLGYLSGSILTDASLQIAQRLKTAGIDVCAVWDEYEAGKCCDHLLIQSAEELWSRLRKPAPLDVRYEGQNQDADWGRIIQIRSLPPIVALQLLTVLKQEFDVELLFVQLASRVRMSHVGPHPGSGQCWSFTMKYYYLNDGKASSYEGQQSGPLHKNASGLYICRGTSIVTISVRSKRPSASVSDNSMRMRWTCLVLSTNQQTESMNVDFVNYAAAFLWAVGQELSGIRRELRRVSQHIALLAVPSDEFLFNEAYRDSLIFEDTSYSNSKTYFWALQSLRTVNDCIISLLAAWDSFDNFLLSDFLSGLDEVDPTQQEPKGSNGSCLLHIKEEVVKLKELQTANLARQEEIESLRDGVFNASTVLEARTTVLQGRNIELLTYISMVFLPASFVTSLFGMDILSSAVGMKDFAVIFAVVCGATYAMILLFRLANTFRRSKGTWVKGEGGEKRNKPRSRDLFDGKLFRRTRGARNAGAGVDLERNR